MGTFQKFPEFGPRAQFDGFDDQTVYQMVPVGGRRELGVITDADDLVLRSKNPSAARFANIRTSSGPLRTADLTPEKVVLPPRSRVAFSVMGIAAGHADVVLEQRNGIVRELLLVSVKSKKQQAYNLAFLRDIRRSTSRTHADGQAKMKLVEETYLQQANLELRMVNPPTDVVAAKNLGDPVRVDRPDIITSIIDATPPRLFGSDAIIIYSVWDASDHRPSVGITPAGGKLCFIDDVQLNDFEAALTFAHEVGHALTLRHNSKHVLMAGDGISRTSRLAQFEIDTVNQSGIE